MSSKRVAEPHLQSQDKRAVPSFVFLSRGDTGTRTFPVSRQETGAEPHANASRQTQEKRVTSKRKVYECKQQPLSVGQ